MTIKKRAGIPSNEVSPDRAVYEYPRQLKRWGLNYLTLLLISPNIDIFVTKFNILEKTLFKISKHGNYQI